MTDALATVDHAEQGWAGVASKDQALLQVLADEADEMFSDGRDVYERACQLLAMCARLWNAPGTRDYIMDLRRRTQRDMVQFLDENAPLMHDVLERALQGDEDVTKMQVDVAFKMFHQRYGRPTQRIAHEHSGGITHEHLQDSEQSLVAAFAAVSEDPQPIIDTEAVAVESGEPVAGAEPGAGHAAVHPESRALAGDSG